MLAHLHEMGRHLVGRSPFAIKHFSSVMYLDYAVRRPAMDFWSALERARAGDVGHRRQGVRAAGVQPAGRTVPRPDPGVRQRLVGPRQDAGRVRARHARRGGRAGFTALKFDPFTNPWRTHIGRGGGGAGGRARARGARGGRPARSRSWSRCIGAWRPTRPSAWRSRLEPFEPFWYEEPIDAEDMDGLAEVRRADRAAGGDRRSAVQQERSSREVFAQRAADILNPDVCNCGGILALKEIAAMAEPCARHRLAAQLQQHDASAWPHAARLGVHSRTS